MATDKHSVVTDALATLGTIITDAEKRDAIHLAVEPVVAGSRLVPGDHVGLKDGVAVKKEPYLGIVDPFLKAALLPGDRFWLVVYPRQIRSLRHVWEHPGFPASDAPAAASKEVSEAWLQDFVQRSDCPDYHTVIAAAVRNEDEYLYFPGEDAHGEIPDEFWNHVEVVTGLKIDDRRRARYFSCSC